MPIHIEFSARQELLLTVEGEYGLEQLDTAIAEGLKLGDVLNITLDLCEAKQDLSALEMEQLTRLLVQRVPSVLLVVADVLYYGFARSIQAFGISYDLNVKIEYRQP